MNNSEHTQKKVNLYMKVEPSVADLVLQAYEEQMRDESGIPFKGEYIGSVFSQALENAVKKDEATEQEDLFDKNKKKSFESAMEQEKKKNRLLIFLSLLLVFFIGLIFMMYRRAVRYG